MSEGHLAFGTKTLAGAKNRDVERRVADSVVALWGRLGRSREDALARINLEMARQIPRAVLAELSLATSFAGKRVLDLGAGLGGLSLEVALAGASVVAVEPDPEWCGIVADRLRSTAQACIVAAVGERLPFPASSFDVIVSLQVLEHVHDPAAVLREAYRVLRPGGVFYLSCENYLSFWEPHYNIRWFPLLPKRLGCWYLKLRGRSSDFLMGAVTYTTALSVRRHWRRQGFLSLRDEEIRAKFAGTARFGGWKGRVAPFLSRLIPARVLAELAISIVLARSLFRRGINVVLQKPVHQAQPRYGTTATIMGEV